MKRTILRYGLISGVLSAVLMILTTPFINDLSGPGDPIKTGELIGYAALVLCFLLVFFGVRSYRDNVGGGTISIGRGLAIGLLITLISSTFYVATWEVLYFKFLPGFGDRLAGAIVAEARQAGASPEVIAQKEQEARDFKAMYDRPLMNIAMTFTEPLPVGLAMTLISALVLRRKPVAGPPPGAAIG